MRTTSGHRSTDAGAVVVDERLDNQGAPLFQSQKAKDDPRDAGRDSGDP